MKLSWFNQRSLFFWLFIFVMLFHVVLLSMKLSEWTAADIKDNLTPEADVSAPLKVKIIYHRDHPFMHAKQIVDSESSLNSAAPKKLKYLSDKNRSFDRQTVAKKIAPFESSGQGSGKINRDRITGLKLSDLNADGGIHPLQKAAQEYVAAKRGVRSGDPLKRAISSTSDHIEDVPLGDLTHLNTTEYKYYGFYHRIRQKLEQFWGSSIQTKAQEFARNGRVIDSDNFITSLQVTLDELGEIIAIKVMGTSGVKELDEAAIESFNDAGPFPNPPRGLLVDGKVVIQWGFVVKS